MDFRSVLSTPQGQGFVKLVLSCKHPASFLATVNAGWCTKASFGQVSRASLWCLDIGVALSLLSVRLALTL